MDLERLKHPYTGLAEYNANMGRYLLRQRPPSWSYTFLLPPGMDAPFEGDYDTLSATKWRRHFRNSSPGFDLWHVTWQGSAYLPPKGTPYVVTIHDLNFLSEKSPPKARKRLRRLQRVVDGACALTFISEHTRQVVLTHLSVPDVPERVIHNGFDPDRFVRSERPDFAPTGEFLFAIGVVKPKKNFHVLVEFLAGIEEVSLVIAGVWSDRDYVDRIKALAVEHGVSDRIILPGGIDDAERNWLYQNCRAALVPSMIEGFGFPLVEAMSFGKPVFSSVYGSLPEIGGDSAFYFQDFSPEAMVREYRSSLATFAADESRADRLKDRARGFQWSRSVEQYSNLYKELLGEES